MPRFWPVPLAVIALLTGCATAQTESAQVGPSAAVERAMRLHYERHASEGSCFNPYIDGFTQLTVLEDTRDRLVVRARYFYRDRFQEGGVDEGGQRCTGFAERTFTLARSPDGGVVVVEMTGEQDEPAIRSLIRRILPG